jgi:hypothetical protein
LPAGFHLEKFRRFSVGDGGGEGRQKESGEGVGDEQLAHKTPWYKKFSSLKRNQNPGSRGENF